MFRTFGPFSVVTGEVRTGVFVASGDLISVAGGGAVNVGPYGHTWLPFPVLNADGINFLTPVDGRPAPSLLQYSLIWKIGLNSWRQGGTDPTRFALVDSNGEIILNINESFPSDNSGEWNVIVTVESPDTLPRRTGEPALRITGVEAVQIIQRSDNSVALVENKRTMVRVFIDSGISDGSDLGAGPNLQANVTGVLLLTRTGSRTPFTRLTPVNPGGVVTARPMATMDRTNLTHSLNFMLSAGSTGTVNFDVRGFVVGHDGDTSGGFTASRNLAITFRPSPVQELVPILLSDTRLGLGPPTLNEYSTGSAVGTGSLVGAIARYPIADNGFFLHPPLFLPFNEDLTTAAGWRSLLSNLSLMALYFPSIPGGIRTALVKDDPRYVLLDGTLINGIGTARYVLNVPTFVARVGLPATFAHEMGHCFRIDHASCPPPGAPGAPTGLDARLPAGTEDVGILMQPMPATLIPPGRGELMSYCGGQLRWPSIAFVNIMLEQDPIS